MSIRFWAAAVVVASLTVTGCGTNVGKGGTNGGGPAPQVVITPIGYKALASNLYSDRLSLLLRPPARQLAMAF